jgi:two-component system sensor histidine kinase DegS
MAKNKPAEAGSDAPPADDDAGATPAPALVERLGADAAALERELAEIDMLISQARTEAGRHEQKRSALAEKVTALVGQHKGEPADLVEQNAQLVTLTRRAAVMEAQVDLLEGKRKTLARYHEALAGIADVVRLGGASAAAASDSPDDPSALPPALSRVVLSAQEDLRREIARAMHDGPAQSLTNIVLQAQIVERLMASRPEAAAGEVRQLISMVQQTLDATKSFIFDVRPMVLDDLGLVPTLRRAARDRGRRAGVPVEFDSIGQDRRLPVDMESGLFRILDEALSAYLAGGPDRITIKLDWGDRLEGRVVAWRGPTTGAPAAAEDVDVPAGADVPPALVAMIEDRAAGRRAKVEAARVAALVTLPAAAWREIRQRAATIGASAELLAEGSEMRLLADLPVPDGASAGG